MAKRRAMKLFAVTMFAGASSAVASPATHAAQGAKSVAEPNQPKERTQRASYIEAAVKPRLIGDRPAPGNVNGGKRHTPVQAAKSDGIELERSTMLARGREPERSLEVGLAAIDTAQA